MAEYIRRRKSKKILLKNVAIGGDAPITVQSMTNIPIEDTAGTIAQIKRLGAAGADIVRLALRSEKGVEPLKDIIKAVDLPLVADIHFDYRLALAAIDAGISKVRINPGNIGESWKVREVVRAAEERGVPIRIGVNGGSINRRKYSHPTPEALVDSAMENIRILEDLNYTNIAVSIKSSDVFSTIEANIIMAEARDYPIHVGLTEAGYGLNCTVQSSVVIGHLLLKGIGDTIRVSMTGDPKDEVLVGRKILESLNLRYSPLKIISCPTCGRTAPDIDLLKIAESADVSLTQNFGERLRAQNRILTVAVMGCEVNGPGEAKEADYGLAGGQNGKMILFARGEILKTVNVADAIDELVKTVAENLNI